MKKLSWLLVIVMVFSFVLTACTPAEEPAEEPVAEETEEEVAEEPAEAEPRTVIIGTTDQISSLDYADAYATHDWEIMRNVNRGLMGFVPGTADLTPVIAADYPTVSEDGLTYTFTLSEGWAYPDGTPLVAGDFVRAFERASTLGGDVSGLVVTYVESVTAPDDMTVVYQLKVARGDFPQIVSSTPYYPVPEGFFPADALEKFPATLVGVGPYQVTSYVANEQLVLEPNPNYVVGLPEGAPERVIIRYFSAPEQMSLAVENGEIDVAWRILGPIEAARLESVDSVTVVNQGAGGIRYLVPNHTFPPFDNKAVRQAVAYLVDRDDIIDRALQGRNNPLYSMVPPGFLGANEAFLDRYNSPDVGAAEALLAAEGYTEAAPLVLDLWYPPEHYGTAAAQIFQLLEEQLEATPLVQVNLQVQEWSTYIGAATSGEYPIFYLGWFYDYPDTSNFLDPFAQSEASPYMGVNYASEEMDALLAAAAADTDQAVRADLYDQAQNLYAEDVVTIPLTTEDEYVVLNNATVTNVVIGPAQIFMYEFIEFAQ